MQQSRGLEKQRALSDTAHIAKTSPTVQRFSEKESKR